MPTSSAFQWSLAVESHLPINNARLVAAPAQELHHLLARYSVYPRTFRRDVYSQQKKIPEFFSSSVRCFVKSSMVSCARATPFTTATISSVLETPNESRTDFRTSQGEVSGFRRGTGTKGILAPVQPSRIRPARLEVGETRLRTQGACR
jgi:hypothetical protein